MSGIRCFGLAWLVLSLSQCNGVRPYSPEREAWRADVREIERDASREAFERGRTDGQFDAQSRRADDYRQRPARYNAMTERAYAEGYREGYGGGNSSDTNGDLTRDPIYSQGYDYGIRDRVSGKPADPEAHVGRYDARYRVTFERGYFHGYQRQ